VSEHRDTVAREVADALHTAFHLDAMRASSHLDGDEPYRFGVVFPDGEWVDVSVTSLGGVPAAARCPKCKSPKRGVTWNDCVDDAPDAWHSVPAAAPEPRGVPLPTRESLGGPGVNTWHSVEEGGE